MAELKTAQEIFDRPDDLVEWVRRNPETAAALLRRARITEREMDRLALEISWITNPDRMGT